MAYRIGIAGLGTVGSGLLQILLGQNKDTNVFRCASEEMTLTAVSARDRNKDRGIPLRDVEWFDDPRKLAKSATIDIFVELVGGADGIARESVEIALNAGKHVVTANKALLATHGLALSILAEKSNVALRYEAAVAGAIPIISAMCTGASAMEVTQVRGILNGTCNYILTQMGSAGLDYATALQEAQDLGYAESDPTLDVGGHDAAHKLSILSAIAFGVLPNASDISVTGIQGVSVEDIATAKAKGSRIRLIAESKRDGASIEWRVAPVEVSETDIFGAVEGADNHVQLSGLPIGVLNFGGPGAGEGPTAGAVAGDILAIVRGARGPVFGRPVETSNANNAG